jgi:hypothetical protein
MRPRVLAKFFFLYDLVYFGFLSTFNEMAA